MKDQSIFIKKPAKGRLPSLPFSRVKDKILGKSYTLDITFESDPEIKRLNQLYRKINKPTDILAFPLSKKEGQIVISLNQVKKKAGLFNKSFKSYLGYLLIHGLLHLKGQKHGKMMEILEKKWSNYFHF
ncbi:MAG TPA: rRNA maturation RNase YbeY [Candidatus Paceibacterota bacterium]|nr:rRNA maturation RNase YbeY [Candidatus Paceibacterota bacterium]